MSGSEWQIGPVGVAVLATLLVMSIVSVAVAFDRWRALRGASRATTAYARRVDDALRRGGLQAALDIGRVPQLARAPLAHQISSGLEEWLSVLAAGGDRDSAFQASRFAADAAATAVLGELRRGIPALATIASTAPFVGLFGTTFGIIEAFDALAVTQAGGDMSRVMSGIAEALVTTAFGLLVAVPAVWLYNALLARVGRVEAELERGRSLLMMRLSRE